MTRSPILLVAATALLLGGCYESPDVTNFEPGIYKGSSDPLMDKIGSEEYQEQMRERLVAGQTDR